LKKAVSQYFFSRIEFVYFSFLYLILINLMLNIKLRKLVSGFLNRFEMLNNSELSFVVNNVLINLFKSCLINNILLVKQFVLILVNNLFQQHLGNILLKNKVKSDSYLYYVFYLYNFSIITFLCKKNNNQKRLYGR
jgi:hypothetical protein